jgi:hypothetical protein
MNRAAPLGTAAADHTRFSPVAGAISVAIAVILHFSPSSRLSPSFAGRATGSRLIRARRTVMDCAAPVGVTSVAMLWLCCLVACFRAYARASRLKSLPQSHQLQSESRAPRTNFVVIPCELPRQMEARATLGETSTALQGLVHSVPCHTRCRRRSRLQQRGRVPLSSVAAIIPALASATALPCSLRVLPSVTPDGQACFVLTRPYGTTRDNPPWWQWRPST